MRCLPRLRAFRIHGCRGRKSLPALAAVLALTLASVAPLWAAPAERPFYQTVPPPEPTSTPQPRPTATRDSEESPAATPTVLATGEAGAATATPQPPIELPEGVLTGVVTAEPRLNMRAAPSTEAAIVGKLGPGTVIGVEGRNAAGDWWYVCCVPGEQSRGWVSAEFVQPNFTAAQAAALPVVAADFTPQPRETVTATVTATVTVTVTAPLTATGATALALTMVQTPALAQQGQEIVVRFTISNTGALPAVGLVLRDELPAELEYLGGEAARGGSLARRAGRQSGAPATVSWPELAAGQAVSAEFRLRVASGLPNGLVFDHVAVARAENAQETSAALVVGMPPAGLPTFR